MSDVFIMGVEGFKADDTAPEHSLVIGVYSDADKAVEALESIFDDESIFDNELIFDIGVGIVEYIKFTVEIKNTAWALDLGWRKVNGGIHRVSVDETKRPLTKKESEREFKKLVKAYTRAFNESAAHE